MTTTTTKINDRHYYPALFNRIEEGDQKQFDRQVDIMKYYQWIEIGAEPSLLHEVCRRGYWKMAESLIAHVLKFSGKDTLIRLITAQEKTSGKTALHVLGKNQGIYKEQVDCLAIALKIITVHQPILFIKDKEGNTPVYSLVGNINLIVTIFYSLEDEDKLKFNLFQLQSLIQSIENISINIINIIYTYTIPMRYALATSGNHDLAFHAMGKGVSKREVQQILDMI